MKVNSTFHIFVFLMALLTFGMPFVTLAQQNSAEAQVIADMAAVDASKDVNKPLWFGAGCLISGLATGLAPGIAFLPGLDWYSCLLPPIGLTGIYFYQPAPPITRLVGKSPEYVEIYTATYKAKRRNTQTLWAAAGCASGGVVVGGVAVFVIGALAGYGAAQQ